MAKAFQLVLRLHTPVILPIITPRLDTLLAEAVRHHRLDWESPVDELPLTWDEQRGGYRGSQAVFGTTAEHGLSGQTIELPSSVRQLPLHAAIRGKKRVKSVKLDGASTAPKLTSHNGYLSPYLIFYGDGDPQACLKLLSMIHHVGKEHARGQGFFTVESVESDTGEGWRMRPWRSADDHTSDRYTPVPDTLRMGLVGDDVPVFRPPRVLREVLF